MRAKLIAEKIRAVIEKRGVNQAEAAKEIGVTATSLGRLLMERHKWLKPENETKIAEWLRRNGQKMPFSNVTLLPAKFRVVRVYGLTHAAEHKNIPCDIPPDVHDTELPTIIYLTNTTHRLVAFKVEGDSMLPILRDGMNVICDCDIPTTEIHNGNIVVAKFDGKAVIKRYRRDGENIALNSDNVTTGECFSVHVSQIQWMLRAIGIMGDL